MNAYGQKTPDLYFNHLFFVLDPSDLKAISKSHFINDSLVVCETKITKADSQDTWTGTYLFGSSNYIEFFGLDCNYWDAAKKTAQVTNNID